VWELPPEASAAARSAAMQRPSAPGSGPHARGGDGGARAGAGAGAGAEAGEARAAGRPASDASPGVPLRASSGVASPPHAARADPSERAAGAAGAGAVSPAHAGAAVEASGDRSSARGAPVGGEQPRRERGAGDVSLGGAGVAPASPAPLAERAVGAMEDADEREAALQQVLVRPPVVSAALSV